LADGVLASGEAAKHPAPGDIPQRMKDDIQPGFLKINHVVEYRCRSPVGQPFG
jgi:hypothetical protein